MLRHYESLGLVRPTGRTGAGYREYSHEDMRLIFHIESLRSLGLSLRDVRRALDETGFTPSELVDDLIRQTRRRIAAETELLTRLRRVGGAEPAGWVDVLQIVALLQALRSESAGRRQRAALSSVDEVRCQWRRSRISRGAPPPVLSSICPRMETLSSRARRHTFSRYATRSRHLDRTHRTGLCRTNVRRRGVQGRSGAGPGDRCPPTTRPSRRPARTSPPRARRPESA